MRTQVTIEHRVHLSDRAFDDVVGAFESVTGSVEEGFSSVAAGATDAASFEAIFEAREGSSGFMRIDHGRWFDKFGIGGRSVLYILGNPLIARTMMRHDISAGLYVPVRLSIEQKLGKQVEVAYDLPSTLMSVFANPDVTEAALKLDAKLTALGETITGAQA